LIRKATQAKPGSHMSEWLHKLAARKAETMIYPGRHSDGGGLYLAIETGENLSIRPEARGWHPHLAQKAAITDCDTWAFGTIGKKLAIRVRAIHDCAGTAARGLRFPAPECRRPFVSPSQTSELWARVKSGLEFSDFDFFVRRLF
jgi:hypothetical protein